MIVAIDGPSGVGKSSVSHEVARRLDFDLLDTGAMYRAVTWAALQDGVDVAEASAVESFARTMKLDFEPDRDAPRMVVDGRVVSEEAVRSAETTANVSLVARVPEVRQRLIDEQRRIIAAARAAGRGIVVEGRDITTVVTPDAEVRVLLTASPEARLARRAAQTHGRDDEETRAAVHEHVVARDTKDSEFVTVHEAAQGVTVLDSSNNTFEQTVEQMLGIINQAESAPEQN